MKIPINKIKALLLIDNLSGAYVDETLGVIYGVTNSGSVIEVMSTQDVIDQLVSDLLMEIDSFLKEEDISFFERESEWLALEFGADDNPDEIYNVIKGHKEEDILNSWVEYVFDGDLIEDNCVETQDGYYRIFDLGHGTEQEDYYYLCQRAITLPK